uniref:PP1-binding domain-containing protein n=1 Tax=Gouania willdenowi TaxID=441366 RepID=A0A8C5HC96_GOUWI
MSAPILLFMSTDKSRLAQMKARRRSNIGGRGSPETNSLIRFMAQQRMKNLPKSQTPEISSRAANDALLLFLYFCNSDGNSCDAGKENSPPATPTNSKRRRRGLLESCNQEIRETPAPIQHSSLKKQKVLKCWTGVWNGLLVYYLASAAEHSGFCCCIAEDESSRTPTIKKKKVCFGGPLSPELFDKNLPPSTPLHKGATPARAQTPGGSFQLRPVLKTPQRNESKAPDSVLEFSFSDEFSASPTLVFHCRRKEQSEHIPNLSTKSEPNRLNVFSLNAVVDGVLLRETVYIMCLFPQQPDQSEPVKRSTRSSARSASRKIKVTSTVRRWNKDVDRSLYGSREYASKMPSLSPITEKLFVTCPSPQQQMWFHIIMLSFIITVDTHQESPAAIVLSPSGDLAVTASVEDVSKNAVVSIESCPTRALEEGSRMSGSKVAELKTKFSDVDSGLADTGETEDISEGQTPAVSEGSPSHPGCDISLHLHMSDCSPSDETGNPHVEPAECPSENINSSCAALEEASVAHVAPWHADFNIEDVFKPIPSRGQRSVRRSLRNRSEAQHSSSAGLAWMPRTSPDNSKETRRRTRGRRLSTALPEHVSP